VFTGNPFHQISPLDLLWWFDEPSTKNGSGLTLDQVASTKTAARCDRGRNA
jgi:hypothetical protein